VIIIIIIILVTAHAERTSLAVKDQEFRLRI
jgi:hypothetical protein